MANRLQFSIRFLLAATVAVAAGAGVVRAEPSWQTALAIDALTTVFLTAAIIGIIQTNGGSRAFWIGTALVLIPAFYGACKNALVALSYLVGFGSAWVPAVAVGDSFLWVLWCAAPANGLLALILNWLFANSRPPA